MRCHDCDGEGAVEYQCGYRCYGTGYGDAEPVYQWRDCATCRGSGEVADDDNEAID